MNSLFTDYLIREGIMIEHTGTDSPEGTLTINKDFVRQAMDISPEAIIDLMQEAFDCGYLQAYYQKPSHV